MDISDETNGVLIGATHVVHSDFTASDPIGFPAQV